SAYLGANYVWPMAMDDFDHEGAYRTRCSRRTACAVPFPGARSRNSRDGQCTCMDTVLNPKTGYNRVIAYYSRLPKISIVIVILSFFSLIFFRDIRWCATAALGVLAGFWVVG